MKRYYYGAAALLVIVYCIVLFLRKRRRKTVAGLDYRSEGTNIVLGITNCKSLHRELVKQIHPDRIAEERREQADELVQQINAARYDYGKLVELKVQVSQFLNSQS